MTIPARNQHPDSALRETCNAKTQLGTHLAPTAPASALFVSRGTGTLGTNQAALSVSPGTGVVDGAKHTIGSEQSVDISGGDGQPRRDVVYLDETGSIAVKEGDPAPFAWDSTLDQSERTLTNAYQPPAPDLADTAGLALATVTIGANSGSLSTGAIDLIRPRAPVIPGIKTGVVSGEPMQTALDGHVVAVAPGLGVVDAIDRTAAPTPVQDAIDAVESVGTSADGRYGAGSIILPPGVTETPGDLHSMGGKHMEGVSREATVLRVTDSSANCFAIGGPGSNSTKGSLDAMTIEGGDRTARTGGSAINFNASPPDASTADMISVGFNIGDVQFQFWGGPDPVIQGFGKSFSAQWDYLRATDYDGKFLEGRGFDNHIRQINVNHGDTRTPVVDLQNPNGPVHIGGINAGGASHRVLRLDGGSGWHAAVYIEDINVEPDKANEGTLDPSVAPAPVELYGPMPTAIGSVHQAHELTSRYTVAIGDRPNYSGSKDPSPGRNRIGNMWYGGGPTDGLVGVLDPPLSPSWFWGARVDIDYNGHDQRAVIPMEDISTEPDAAGGGVALSPLTDESANRTTATWYQNTTGGPLQATVWRSDSAGGRVRITFHINDTQNNRAVVVNTDSGDGSNTTHVTANALIPVGNYYKIIGSGDPRGWYEASLS